MPNTAEVTEARNRKPAIDWKSIPLIWPHVRNYCDLFRSIVESPLLGLLCKSTIQWLENSLIHRSLTILISTSDFLIKEVVLGEGLEPSCLSACAP